MINKATPYDVLLSGGMAESAVSKETTNASKFMYIFLWQGENENHSAIISAFNQASPAKREHSQNFD